MSTGSPPDITDVGAGVGSPVPVTPTAPPPNSDLVQETKNQIRTIVQEITQLSQSDVEAEDFYDEFLPRVCSALASIGGAVWVYGDNGNLELQYQVNIPKTGLAEDRDKQISHGLLLRKLAEAGQPTLVPPQSGSADGQEAGNPTDTLLVVAPLTSELGVHGLVEIFQRPGGGPTTQRGYLRFLSQMCDLASDYLKNRKLRNFQNRESLWEQLEQFICMVHGSLDVTDVAYTVANEGRRIVECDRVSVAITNRKQATVEAVSGLDSLDRRAEEVQLMGRLATAVIEGHEPLWYPRDEDELAPQVEEILQSYLDQSHATLVAVLPLSKPAADSEEAVGEPIGALIFEQLRKSRVSDQFQRRAEAVSGYAANALANAIEHNSLFLMPVWKAIGNASWLVKAKTLPKTITCSAALLLVAAVLAFFPSTFFLAASGKLQPADRQQVFAPSNGVVDSVVITDESVVSPGDVLLTLRDSELETQFATLDAKVRSLREQMNSKNRRLANDYHLSPSERVALEEEIPELRETLIGQQHQLQLLQDRLEKLTVRSEIHAQVMTWEVVEKLRRRPVQKGQSLLALANPDGNWELELYMPLKRIGHVQNAAELSEQPLSVSFSLTTHPGEEFQGTVIAMDQIAQTRGEEGNCVRLRVALDKDTLPELRDGTTVTAKVDCGSRSIGYVWFHELFETIQSKVLFWI